MNNPHAKELFQEQVLEMSQYELLKLARTVRACYVDQVNRTVVQLDPKRLRSLDAEIKRLEQELKEGA